MTKNSQRAANGLWAAAMAAVAAAALLPAAAWAGTTWDGGGIDTNFTTGANWDDNSAPTFTGGTSTLTFGSGGSTATVDTAAELSRIILNRDAAFTIANGSGALTLQGETVGGVLTGITASPATAGTTVAYTISESIALGATQSWNVANNGAGGTSLSVSGVVSGAGAGLTKLGSGTLALTGANTFTGQSRIEDGTVRITSWINNNNANGAFGNSANALVLGGTSTAAQLIFSSAATSGTNLESDKPLVLGAAGGTIKLEFTGNSLGRDNIAQLRGVISGSGGLTVDATNARFIIYPLPLPAQPNNTFTGPLTLVAGELQASLSNLTGTGTATPFGAGANGLGSALTMSPGTVLNLWTQNVNRSIRLGSLAGSGTVRGEAGGTKTFIIGGDDTSTTFAGTIVNGIDNPGPLAITKTGSGTLTLTGSSSYTGATRIEAGRLTLSGNGVLGSGSYSAAITNNGELVLGSGAAQILSSPISGTGSLTKLGSGTLTLTGANTFTGQSRIEDGTVRITSWINNNNANGAFGNSANALVLGGTSTAAQLIFSSTATSGTNLESDKPLVLGAAGGTIKLEFTGNSLGRENVASLRGVISGSGGLTVDATNARFAIYPLPLPAQPNNTFTGPLTLVAGELQASLSNLTGTGTATPFGAGANGLGSALTMSPGTVLNLWTQNVNRSIRLGSLAGSGTVRGEAGGTKTFIIGGDDTSTTFAGTIVNGIDNPGPVAITKTGAGRLTLSGSSSYTGATRIEAGILEIASGGRINGSSGITLNGSTAEFKYNSATALTQPLTLTQGVLSGTGTIGTAVTIGSGVILAPGNSPDTQSYTSLHAWAPGGTYQFEFNALSGTPGVNWDFVNVSSGTFNLSALAATPGSQFTLDLVTLDAFNVAGSLATPYDGGSYTLPIASYDPANFLLPSGFSNTAGADLTSLFTFAGLANWQGAKPQLGDISVKINSSATGIDLVIVPEPTALSLVGIGSALAAWAVRRRRRAVIRSVRPTQRCGNSNGPEG